MRPSAAMHVQIPNIRVALARIKASHAVLKLLLGPALQAELLILDTALESYHTACQSQELLATATARQELRPSSNTSLELCHICIITINLPSHHLLPHLPCLQ